MSYTLQQFAAECRAALMKNPGPAGRELCRQYTERACSDRDFVGKHFGLDNTEDRKILYEDPDLKFCILAHGSGAQRQSIQRESIMQRTCRGHNASCLTGAAFAPHIERKRAATIMRHVGEVHLAGFAEDRDSANAPLLIDDHGRPVDEAVWELYRRALARGCFAPTLIEWDNNVPLFDTLAAEAERAREVLLAQAGSVSVAA